MEFVKIVAHGGVTYRCLLFDNVTVAADDIIDSEAFPMPAANGNYSLQITAVNDDGAADFVVSGSNIPGDGDIVVVSGLADIASGRTALLGPSLHIFNLTGIAYPRVRIVNTSSTDPITVTAYLAMEADEESTDPTDYTVHIACSDIQRQVSRRYKSPVAEQDMLDILNDAVRDIGLHTNYFRSSTTISLSTVQDTYRVHDDVKMVTAVYETAGTPIDPITIEDAARDSSEAWYELQGTVKRYITDGMPVGSIRPYPLPDDEDQTLTVYFIYIPSPLNYLTEYIPIERMHTKVIVDYVCAQLYADENDTIDLRKEQAHLIKYFDGLAKLNGRSSTNATATHEMKYRGI